MFVRMKADGSVPAKGFIANYTRVSKTLKRNSLEAIQGDSGGTDSKVGLNSDWGVPQAGGLLL